jgi:hypothetical protein
MADRVVSEILAAQKLEREKRETRLPDAMSVSATSRPSRTSRATTIALIPPRAISFPTL